MSACSATETNEWVWFGKRFHIGKQTEKKTVLRVKEARVDASPTT